MVWYTMNEGYRAWGGLKSVLSNRGMEIKAKKCLNEGVSVPTVLFRAEAWDMRSVKRRKVNVLEMKFFRSLVGVLQVERVRNEEVRRRARIERELVSQTDRRVLRLFGHGERINEYCMARRVLIIRSQWRMGMKETEVRLDGMV